MQISLRKFNGIQRKIKKVGASIFSSVPLSQRKKNFRFSPFLFREERQNLRFFLTRYKTPKRKRKRKKKRRFHVRFSFLKRRRKKKRRKYMLFKVFSHKRSRFVSRLVISWQLLFDPFLFWLLYFFDFFLFYYFKVLLNLWNRFFFKSRILPIILLFFYNVRRWIF